MKQWTIIDEETGEELSVVEKVYFDDLMDLSKKVIANLEKQRDDAINELKLYKQEIIKQ